MEPPESATADVASFMAALARLRISAGSPSLATLRRRTGIPRTTLHDGLDVRRRRMPSLELVRQVTAACGCDSDQVEQWAAAWRAVREGSGAARIRDVPRQLPAAPRTFVGRKRELDALSALLSGDPPEAPIVAVVGAGGAGKTWLALRWAHDHVEAFPDGQLYVDLRGFDPEAPPVSTGTAMRTLLASMGVRPESIPAEPDARAAAYRTVLAGRRMLLLLDDAADAAQVRALLPGSPTCAVLVTSRRPLTSLTVRTGAAIVPLDLLDDCTARDVLTRGIDRVGDEDEAAIEALVGFCGGLPLALGIVAARLGGRAAAATAAVDELREARDRLDVLATDDLALSLRAALDSSYRVLRRSAARMFALVGAAPTADLHVTAAAALARVPAREALATLRELVDLNLVEEHRPQRFRIHDLVALYAAERARALPEDVAREARRRLVHFYAGTAYAGDRLFDPKRPPLAPPADVAGVECVTFADQRAASRWFAQEHAALAAVQRLAFADGEHREVIRLAWSMTNYQRAHGLRRAYVDMWRLGLLAAEEDDEAMDLALAHRYLGHALAGVEEYDEACRHLDLALDMFADLDDPIALAHTHHAYGWVHGVRGDDGRALHHAERALGLFEEAGDDTWVADALNSAGWYHGQLGQLDRAGEYCRRAERICREVGYREGEAYTTDSLADLDHRRGDLEAAVRRYERAFDLFRELDNLVMQADVLRRLADIHQLRGDSAAAARARSDADRLTSLTGAVPLP